MPGLPTPSGTGAIAARDFRIRAKCRPEGHDNKMSPRYRALLAAGVAIAALWPTWPPLILIWITRADYEHGPIAAVIALAWMVRASGQLDAAPREGLPRSPRSTGVWLPALLLGLSLCIWLIASRANVEIGKQAVAPIILWLAVATATGWRGARALSAPILYLYVAIPVWEQIVPLLQWMCVSTAHAAFALAGVPVRIEGILVTIPEGSFIVLEGCSGKRFLIVAVAVAGLLAAVYSMGWRRTAAYLGLTAVMAIVANWLRVIIVITAGHLTNMTSYLVVHEHFSLGWAIFAVLLGSVWALGRRLQEPAPEAPRAPLPGLTPTRAPAWAPAPAPDERRQKSSAPAVHSDPGLVTALALLCVPALATLCAPRWPVIPETPSSLEMPRAGTEWRGPLPPSQQWLPSFNRAASQSRSAFESEAGARVETYWALYGRQHADVKLIYYSNTLVNKDWLLLQRSSSLHTIGGHEVSVRTLLLQTRSGSRWLVDYYYVVDGVSVSQEWQAQILYGVLSWIRPAPAAVIAAAAPCSLTCSDAEHALTAFWAGARPSQAPAPKTLAASRAYTGASRETRP